MAAYWLTYKPLSASSPRGWPADQMTELVRQFEIEASRATPLWRMNSLKAMPGDRVYLFKQGSDPRGIFGVGELVERPQRQPDPTDIDGGPRDRARIKFAELVDPAQEFLLEYSEIAGFLPKKLENAHASGNSIADEIAQKIEECFLRRPRSWPQLESEAADDPAFDPDSLRDERQRAIRAIRVRRGQAAFRASLMHAYGNRCAITDCSVPDVLEAAHITPYLGGLTNHLSNGLLLRADLHTLFDCGLLAIEPESKTVVIADSLTASYSSISGTKLRPPQKPEHSPNKKSLRKRFLAFKKKTL